MDEGMRMAVDEGRVEAVMILEPGESIVSTRLERVQVTEAGFEGDRHAGLTREAGVRDKDIERGTEIRNNRQVSLVSTEEMDEIARRMDLDEVQPEWMGANLCLSGIEDLTKLPQGTRFKFEGGVELVVHGENKPCTGPGEVLEEQYPDRERLASRFPKQALHLRGLVGWVGEPGEIRVGERVEVIVPEQAEAA